MKTSTPGDVPLLSDERIEAYADEWNKGERGITIAHRTCLVQGADWVRDIYEADRQERIQREEKLLALLRKGVEAADAVVGHGYCEGSGSASQDYVNKSAVAKIKSFRAEVGSVLPGLPASSLGVPGAEPPVGLSTGSVAEDSDRLSGAVPIPHAEETDNHLIWTAPSDGAYRIKGDITIDFKAGDTCIIHQRYDQ